MKSKVLHELTLYSVVPSDPPMTVKPALNLSVHDTSSVYGMVKEVTPVMYPFVFDPSTSQLSIGSTMSITATHNNTQISKAENRIGVQ